MKYEIGNVPANFKDRAGQVFGKLKVIERAGSVGGKATWLCHCECGADKVIPGDALAQGQYSCGCTHDGKKTHGASHTKTFRIWGGMKNRCNNPKNKAYAYYGGRGIKVCERWANFESFFEDMGECPSGYSIERINVNGNYDPDNCEWIPLAEQAKNKQKSIRIGDDSVVDTACKLDVKEKTIRYRIKHNVPLDKKVGNDKMISFNGKTMNYKDWAKHIGVCHATISTRIKKGWPTAEVLRAIS